MADELTHDQFPSEDQHGDEARLGSTVRVRDAHGEEEYTLVRRVDADAGQGRISSKSPVGRALLGRRRGDEVEVQTPGGVRLLTMLAVEAPEAPERRLDSLREDPP
jgi:transcription elongation GreA/GreB family factor